MLRLRGAVNNCDVQVVFMVCLAVKVMFGVGILRMALLSYLLGCWGGDDIYTLYVWCALHLQTACI